jgi:hypothetical protein
MDMAEIGHWSFIIGVLIAIIAAFVGSSDTIAMLLVALGAIVGFLNISEKEVYNFLIAAIALLGIGAAGLSGLPAIGSYLGPIVSNIATFVAPAAVIVALKAVYDLGKK